MIKSLSFLAVIFLGVFLSSTASAQLKITAISGASNVAVGTANEVWGGLAGTCPSAGTALCNSCTGNGLVACNENRIQTGATLSFTVETTGTVNLQLIDNDDNAITDTGAGTNSIGVKWGDLCSLAVIPDCDAASGTMAPLTQKSINIKIWQDNNTDLVKDAAELVTVKVTFVPVPATSDETDGAAGVSGFTTFPGDQKVYLDFADLPASTGNGAKLFAIRAIFSDVNFDQAKPGTELGVQDFEVTDDVIEATIVDGLDNYQFYHFRLAMVDVAKNIFYWTSNNYHDGTPPAVNTGGTADCLTAVGATVSPVPACQHVGKPDPVIGLLTKDFNCFVATAAYGSSLEPKLRVFRHFRFLLLQHNWGRSIVSWYNRVGPQAALMISDKPFMRSLTRAMLWPAYGFALLTARLGFAIAFGLIVLFTLAAIVSVVSIRRRPARAKR